MERKVRRLIYVKPENFELFDKAKLLGGGKSMSEVIAEALELYVRKEAVK